MIKFATEPTQGKGHDDQATPWFLLCLVLLPFFERIQGLKRDHNAYCSVMIVVRNKCHKHKYSQNQQKQFYISAHLSCPPSSFEFWQQKKTLSL
jgi:hypothetical protein